MPYLVLFFSLSNYFMFWLHLQVAYVLSECWLISVPANFRRSICPSLAKVMPDFSVNSGMTCARICTSLIFELWTQEMSYSDDDSLPGECSWCHNNRGMCDRFVELDKDRRFSIKLEETFDVETVRNNDKCFFRN